MRAHISFAFAFSLNLAAMPVAASDAPAPACTLKQAVSLDMTTERNGSIAIPVGVDGQKSLMVVDTGSIFSVFGEEEVRARGMSLNWSDLQIEYLGGVNVNRITKVSSLTIGQMTGSDVHLMVTPEGVLEHDAVGMIGPDILSNFDVDIDFAANKFNLFVNDHCPGKVVYWTHGGYAVVPMDLENGHIVVPVTLDGKTVSAVVDTGADRSTISLDLAKSLFGLRSDSPGMKALGETSVNQTQPAPRYRYPFKALSFAGVTVQTPVIDILDGKRFNAGSNEMLLGVKTLRQLHLYIAYKEKALYLTPAEQR
jgi:predicted aspartyl protease